LLGRCPGKRALLVQSWHAIAPHTDRVQRFKALGSSGSARPYHKTMLRTHLAGEYGYLGLARLGPHQPLDLPRSAM
jgi:hypothetical protein